MTKYLFRKKPLGLGILLAAFMAVPVQAMAATSTVATATTSSCPQAPVVSRAFLSWSDQNWYTPAPGVTPDSFSGAGWVLTGGAKVTSTTVADGATGLVLDLPPGSSATSPVTCVQSGEPYARQITRMVGTNASSNATTLYVTRAGSSTLGSGMPVNGGTKWAESPPDNVDPSNVTENVYFTYKSNVKVGDLQVYDLYIDPHMCR